MANITSNKLVDLFGWLTVDAGFFFPITYVINDIATEVYGFKNSRKIIWMGFFANVLALMAIYIVMFLPPSVHWNNQDAFEKVFSLSGRIFIASLISYLFGEFINSISLSKLKVYTKGKYIGMRFIVSTVLGVAIENTMFYLLAFLFVLPFHVIVEMICSQYLLKVIFEIFILPLSCFIALKLKKLEHFDYYDVKTKFNPFAY